MILRRLGYSNGMKFSTEETRIAYEKKLEELDKLDEDISADEARLSAATKKCCQWKQELIEVDQSLPRMRTYANKLIHDSQMFEEELSTVFEQLKNAEILNEEGKKELDQLMAEVRAVDEADIDFEQMQADIDALISEQNRLSSAQLISSKRLDALNAALQSMVKIPSTLDSTIEFAKACFALQSSVKEVELEINDLNKQNAQLIALKDERSKLVASREKARERLALTSSKEAELLKTEEMDLQTQVVKLKEERNILKEAAQRAENTKAELRDMEEKKHATIARLENEIRSASSTIHALCELVKQRNATIESNVQSLIQEVNIIRDELQELTKPSDGNIL
ncbi:hypothetical protein TTRE_0000595801 [Trichuris trichiura]|uniref:Uncharacterized protein n=1 Tax=Trichuris trichiura TaxID=36087 RepID=A0A077ZGC7_TRITR|nr:hypothetical protein TTRE_0000595801 [Trichuris trichiura]